MPREKTTKGRLDLSRKKAGSFQTGKDYLLAIGINEYATHARLKNAVKDIRDIATLLASRYAFRKEAPFIRYLPDGKATKRAIRKSLRGQTPAGFETPPALIRSSAFFLNSRTF